MFRVARQTIPTASFQVAAVPFWLRYMEIVNPTAEPITFSACDGAGLCVLPPQEVAAHGVLTYRADFGAPVNGLWWQASAPGLCGWVIGDTQ